MPNTTLGIVEAVRMTAERIVHNDDHANRTGIEGDLLVFYGEVFGGTLPAAKHYTTGGTRLTGFRLFDVARINLDLFTGLLAKPIEEIALWRDHGGQPFISTDALRDYAEVFMVQLAPRIPLTSMPPKGVKETHEWLKKQLPDFSRAGLDVTNGKPEGLVLRSVDRSWIVKLRFEDYERTLR